MNACVDGRTGGWVGDCHSSCLDQGQLAVVSISWQIFAVCFPPSAFGIQNESCNISHQSAVTSLTTLPWRPRKDTMSLKRRCTSCPSQTSKFGLGDEFHSGMLLHESKLQTARVSKRQQQSENCCKMLQSLLPRFIRAQHEQKRFSQ